MLLDPCFKIKNVIESLFSKVNLLYDAKIEKEKRMITLGHHTRAKASQPYSMICQRSFNLEKGSQTHLHTTKILIEMNQKNLR